MLLICLNRRFANVRLAPFLMLDLADHSSTSSLCWSISAGHSLGKPLGDGGECGLAPLHGSDRRLKFLEKHIFQ